MDFLTVFKYVLALVETGALIMALVFVTRAMKEKRPEKASRALSERTTTGSLWSLFLFIWF